MFRKSILTLAAIAAVATAAVVTSSDAEAFPRGGFRGAPGGGIRAVAIARPVIGARPIFRPGFRPIFRPGFVRHPGFRPIFRPWHPRWRCGWYRPCWGAWRPHFRPYYGYVAPVAVAAPAPVYAARPAPGPCTCLSKEYTQEGAVLFKDNCTRESAINPPPQDPGPAAQYQPQDPQDQPQGPGQSPQYQPQRR